MEHFGDSHATSDRPNQPELQRASIWARAFAFWIDIAILGAIAALATFVLLLLSGSEMRILIHTITLVLVPLGLLKDMIKGQSPGKFILGIAVRDQENPSQIPSAKALFLRNLSLPIWPIDALVLLFTKKRIGDKFAGTNVYRLSPKPKLVIRLAALLAIPILIALAIQIGVGPRTPISADEFTFRMKEVGFFAVDVTDQFPPEYQMETVREVRTTHFVIQFIALSTEAQARGTYQTNRNMLERESRGAWSSHSEISLSNFSRFAITFDGIYTVISRIEDTFVFAQTSSANRAELDDLLRILGY